MQPDLDALAHFVRERMDQLSITVDDLTARGGPSDTTMTKILRARPPAPARTTLRKLEVGLGWEQGSAAGILEGGTPTLSAVVQVSAVRDQAQVVVSRISRNRTSLSGYSTLDLLTELEERFRDAEGEIDALRKSLNEGISNAQEQEPKQDPGSSESSSPTGPGSSGGTAIVPQPGQDAPSAQPGDDQSQRPPRVRRPPRRSSPPGVPESQLVQLYEQGRAAAFEDEAEKRRATEGGVEFVPDDDGPEGGA